jgi:hypothetical protein
MYSTYFEHTVLSRLAASGVGVELVSVRVEVIFTRIHASGTLTLFVIFRCIGYAQGNPT